MKVEIWSDFVCPFCYIGKRRFEKALEQFEHKDKVEIVFRSFELDPHVERNPKKNVYEYLAEKYGMSLEQAKATTQQVGKQAEAVGLHYDFDNMKRTNTFDAHRLAHFANSEGKMEEMTERLMKAYFTEGLHIGDHEVLANLASEVGLDREKALDVLRNNGYADEVRRDEEIGRQLGITGVPFFLFNQKYAVFGAQSSDVFMDVLQKVWEEEQAQPSVINLNGKANSNRDDCADGSCSVSENNRG
ncbi:putative DsbA family dithiol-disulfide isomerase [Thermolongibacillus altinsuensis]|jgi:predicted DsbA family dithiol-disulfide isomerase|uniref:Putative DsbA family dithiol-disulfide isomerase n=1 Tax=Thermolongibacillus altinsuensis TaxID=575256 RepID=A0A4R1QIL8_9BACL|nr:DsbA family oxidoreductase [Thermolongibacillus altinsuensis]TCL52643.1 putative DsbA family dithiol-disulfide isomerase [Thermolongibacillus altinsuensis]GMB09799.1 DSBA oxidoreductase [Thermolongibacillus altinsuensis]